MGITGWTLTLERLSASSSARRLTDNVIRAATVVGTIAERPERRFRMSGMEVLISQYS